MAPARAQEDAVEEEDDPVTAEYDVYLTPPKSEQIILLQYPNRLRTRPYNDRHGARPSNVRIKPETGHLEVDVNLSTNYNFNKYKSLQWGDALETSRDIHNSTGTYGPAAGFSAAKPRTAGRLAVTDQADRQNQIQNDLAFFHGAEADNKVMHVQTLGGQIIKHDSADEVGKPIYFVGAFRDNQLHLTKVDGTAQMRPQFHHLDAEEQRARIAASRAASSEVGAESARPAAEARALLAREKKRDDGDKSRLEDLIKADLQAAEAEEWCGLEYVDEDMDAAYELFGDRMFVRDVEQAQRLRSGVDVWEYLDLVAKPRKGGVGGRRRRRRKSQVGAGQGEGGEGEDDEMEGEDGAEKVGGEAMETGE
ncbi:hypothetical protein LTR62_000947 [Meristemomyces frigidus]|uniref:DNA-directed RNA polymerase III subunit Rpc5 n=1 Tax=Meristemomyces frigidus TaxID=1508187 RepID=A0AAN7YBV4_9PEZI|nr:hypothetical protein LTR62_000947 [Meristemomyces frigidus]